MDKVIIFADHQIGYELTKLLLEWQVSEDNSFSILAIFTNLRPLNAWWNPISEIKETGSIPIYYYDTETAYNLINAIECDYLLLLSWRHIIPNKILHSVKENTLNLHFSLLPKHRGVYPVNWAIQSGDKITGVTFHKVIPGIDEGEIIIQKEISIEPTDDAKSLLHKLDKLAIDAFSVIWPIRNNWNAIAIEQQGISSYHSKNDFSNSNKISLSKTYQASDLISLLRAKTFGEIGSSAYFIDQKTGEKYSISIHIANIIK